MMNDSIEIKQKLEKWTQEYCDLNETFLVDVSVRGLKYEVMIDTPTNVTIKECAKLNRILQKKLDEDPSIPKSYTLDVSSPGMSNPLKVKEQYVKRIGKELEFTLIDGQTYTAKLIEVDTNDIKVEINIPSNKKTKTTAQSIVKSIPFIKIKKTLIPFKINKK